MSREHYVMKLRIVTSETGKEGDEVLLFVNKMLAIAGRKDGTCDVYMDGGKYYHVSQSAKTILEKARGFNVIVELT